MKLDAHFWSNKYKLHQTGWDIGYASPPIISYFNQLDNKDLKILIPGCGNAYEAILLFEMGFKNLYILDFVKETLNKFEEKQPNFPKSQILYEDFFSVQDQFDIIIEQTFFCALLPDQRKAYVSKMKSLLKPNGKLVGLFFENDFEKTGPPFGGNKKEYLALFSSSFKIKKLEKCYNSIPPRMDNELFFIFENN
ncbi:methyltransferase domain-containing protein [Aquimarina sp. BL5]|uniref:methyltransferase domain-containing protein n=1 Tax=Aquimarina sp. BL5 TaxID=1714860 RepID=UPI000E550110|nr:methyltransferase domain-containing protein [Aquimarina sp. BL5]AXT53459.1 methyltransferase domain-containing protein [Aquimarina sp. BL5]RKN01598.1 methyltransferase domain-containing protein [Aquimarina sp. BL5]